MIVFVVGVEGIVIMVSISGCGNGFIRKSLKMREIEACFFVVF